jgi:ABC-type transporter Mla subunit MlaD
MVRRHWPLLIVAALAAGCTSDGSPDRAAASDTATAPDPALVAWLDDFCGVDRETSVSWPHDLETPESPTDADRQPLIDTLEQLDAVLAAIDEAAAALEPAPNASAADLLERYRQSYSDLRADFADYAESATWYPLDELDGLYRLPAMTLAGFLPLDGQGLDAIAEYDDLAAAAPHTETCPDVSKAE